MSGEAGLCLERATGWSRPQASRIVLPTWNYRLDNKQLPDQYLPDGADAQAELASVLKIASANIIGIYACDTASPLVSLVGGAPNLVAAGGPLVQRNANGLLYRGRRTGKLGVETVGALSRFQSAAGAFGDINGNVFSGLAVVRFNTAQPAGNLRVFSKDAGSVNGWMIEDTGAALNLYTFVGGVAVLRATVAVAMRDGAWHNIAWFIDEPALQSRIFTDMGDGALGAFVAGTTNATGFALGSNGGSNTGNYQYAYVAGLNIAITSAMRSRFWTHGARPSQLTTYTRANAVRTACAASAVSAWSANQYATRYAATFAARRNWRLEGVANDGPLDFLGIASDNLALTGVGGWTDLNTAGASVDGVSGMRDGVRITMAAAWNPMVAGCRYNTAVAPLVGATATPFRLDAWRRRATVGTTFNMGLYFTGDPGGAETFGAMVADAATPTRWGRIGAAATPVGNAHTGAQVLLGATNNLDNVDVSDVALVHDCSVAPDWWVLRGSGTAVLTQNPAAISVSNAADAVLDHAQGSLRIRTAGYGGGDTWDTAPVLFAAMPNDGTTNGEIAVFRSTVPNFQVRLRDSAGNIVGYWVIAGAGYVDGNEHLIQVDWCAAAPVCYVAGVAWYAAVYFDGVLQAVGGGGTAPVAGWVPAVGGNLYINKYDPAIANIPGRAAVEEITIFPNPSRLLGTAPVVL